LLVLLWRWHGLLHRYAFSGLVLPQTHEDTVANRAISGDLGIVNLDNDLRLTPLCPATNITRDLKKGRLCLLSRLHKLGELLLHRDVETGSHPSAVKKAVIRPDTKNERGKTSVLGGRRPAADHELLPPHAFYFQPITIAGRSIGRIRSLRDNTFQPQAAGLLGHPIPPALLMVTVANAVAAANEEVAQALFAFEER